VTLNPLAVTTQRVAQHPGPLHVPVPAGQTAWAGEPVVEPFVRLTVYLPDGTVATLSGRDYLHAGFG
jgi:hypothetical protein